MMRRDFVDRDMALEIVTGIKTGRALGYSQEPNRADSQEI